MNDETKKKDAWIVIAEMLYAMPREERIRVLVASVALVGLEASVVERLTACRSCGRPVEPRDLDGPPEPKT